MIAIPKLRIQFGAKGPLRIYSLNEHSTSEFTFHSTEQSKKRVANELKEVQAKKKHKLDHFCNEFSSFTDRQVKKTSGAQASKSKPQSNNELKATDFPDIPPEKSLRAIILKAQLILKAKHEEEEEKARRTEAEMRAAKIAAKRRAEAGLKQKREKQRLELAQMEKSCNFEENNYRKVEKDFLDVCGRTSLRNIRMYVEEKLGLILRNDECPELEKDICDLEEGEI